MVAVQQRMLIFTFASVKVFLELQNFGSKKYYGTK